MTFSFLTSLVYEQISGLWIWEISLVLVDSRAIPMPQQTDKKSYFFHQMRCSGELFNKRNYSKLVGVALTVLTIQVFSGG
jgi:hypothetical protein